MTMKDHASDTDLEFFVEIEYEKLPKFCEICSMMGHEITNCRNTENLSSYRGNLERMSWKKNDFERRDLARQNTKPVQGDLPHNFRNKDDSIQKHREERAEGRHLHVPPQTKPGPPSARQLDSSSPIGNNTARAKPWSVDRATKLDKLATEIMAAEAMKLITRAYEDVFEGSKGKKRQ